MRNDTHSQFADMLMNSEHNLFSLLSMFKDTLVFIFDSTGHFIFGHTDSRSKMYNHRDDFIGKTVPEIMPDHVAEPFHKAFEKNKEGEVAEFDYWMDMVTHTSWFNATCTPVFRNGVFDGSMAVVRDVTRNKIAEKALKTSEHNYRTLVEMAAMGIVIISDGVVVYSNPVTSETTGFSSDEILGHSFLDFVAPSERSRIATIHRDRLQGIATDDVYELKLLKKSGKLIDIEVSAKLIDYQDKPSVQVLMQDITSRKKVERQFISLQETLQRKVAERTKELENYRVHLEEIVGERTGRLRDTINLLRTEIEERMQAEERVDHLNLILRAIRDINQLITGETDVQKLIDGACRKLVESRGYKDAWIFLLNRDGSFRTASEARYGEDLLPLMDHITSGHYTPCLVKSLDTEGVWISDETRSICDTCMLKPESDEPRRVMASKLSCHERIHGVLTVTSLGEHSPDSEEISLFKEICDDIAFTLDSIEHEIARQRTAKALTETQNRYEALFENATAAFMFLERDRILECNTKCAEIFGCTKEELIGKTIQNLSPGKQPDGTTSRKAALEHINKAIESGPRHFRWIHRRANGEDFPAEVAINALMINGKNYIQAVLSDVTVKERAEKALKESERSFTTLYTNVPVGLFRSDTRGAGRLIEANPAMASMFGFSSPESILQISSSDLFADESDRKRMLDALRKPGELRDFIAEMKKTNGEKFWASISARSFSSANTTLVDCILKDISETRKYEASLKKNVESLQKTIEGTVSAMSLLVEMKDPYTSGHQTGVAHLACAIGEEMGLSPDRIDCIRIAATLHDIGKLSIPTEILSKPGTLSENEFCFLKTHPKAGYDILKSIEFPWPVAEVILQHHERLDGSGYPDGLKGRDIMLEAKVIAVSDVVEATASRRPYRESLGIEEALNAVSEGAGIIYDAEAVRACIRLFKEKKFSLLDHDSMLVGTKIIV